MDGNSGEVGSIDVGAVEDVPTQGARTVRTATGDIAIFRTHDNQLFALADQCPHKGGALSQGIVHGHSVTCPLHGLVISLATGSAAMAEEGCTRRYRVRVENGRIMLGIDAA